jgi:hypothetical protein
LWKWETLIVILSPVKAATLPPVGKIVQEVLKLSDETDLDLLNHVMEVMVKHYTTELLPVAASLTARLVSGRLISPFFWSSLFLI